MEQGVRQWSRGRVDGVPPHGLVLGQRDAGRGVPGGVACRALGRQGPHEARVRLEHRVGDTVGEGALADVPGQAQRVAAVHDLAVEPDLRCPGHGVRHLGGYALGGGVGSQGAGEDHRHQHRRAGPAGQLGEYLRAREQGVREVFQELLPEEPRPFGEGGRGVQVHGEQFERGEVAHEAADVLVQVGPVHRRHVEREPAGARPAAYRLGVRGEQRRGQGEPSARGPLGEAVPFGRGQQDLQPAEGPRLVRVGGVSFLPRVADARLPGFGEGQFGRRRQGVEPLGPVGAVAGVRVGLGEDAAGQDVVAEGDPRCLGEGLAAVAALELGEQDAQAGVVDDQHVEGEVEHGPLGGPAHVDPEERPPVGGRLAGGQSRPGALHLHLGFGRREAGQVVGVDTEIGYVGQDLLVAVVMDDGAEHVVPLNQFTPHGGDVVHVEVGVFQFDVGVAADTSVGVGVGAADEVGGLDVRQRERLVAAVRVGPQLRLPRLQVTQDGFLVGAQFGPVGVGEPALGGAETQLSVVGPQHHAVVGVTGQQFSDVHSSPVS